MLFGTLLLDTWRVLRSIYERGSNPLSFSVLFGGTAYVLVDNVAAAEEHTNVLCAEVSDPLTNNHMLFETMIDLLLRYDLKTFDMEDDFDTDEEYEYVSSVGNILPLLANCIDHEVNDGSFTSVVIKGFCGLSIFKKFKSINLISKLLVIWFRRLSREKCDVYNSLVQLFTSYTFYIRSNSSTLGKCYVPIPRVIEENDLTTKFVIKIDEVNSTLINLSRGVLFENEKMTANAHGVLASKTLDYLLGEGQPYTAMSVDILYRLKIDFDNDNELVNILGPKLLRAVKH